MSRVRAAIDRAVETLLALLMAAAVANVVWQVVSRFVLGRPSSVTDELARYLLVWIGLLGAGYAVGRRLHVAVDVLPSLSRVMNAGIGEGKTATSTERGRISSMPSMRAAAKHGSRPASSARRGSRRPTDARSRSPSASSES